jgi:small-conductance mechanosensitive channel
VLKGSVFNYSQGFQFIWDEIKVAFTTSSDCDLARAMLTRVAKEAIGDYLVEAQSSWKLVSDYYETVNPSLDPAITLAVNAGNLEFGVSYIVDYTKRTAMQDQLFTKIVQEVANSNGRLEWAPSATVVAISATTPSATGPQPLSSSQTPAKAATSR